MQRKLTNTFKVYTTYSPFQMFPVAQWKLYLWSVVGTGLELVLDCVFLLILLLVLASFLLLVLKV